MDQFIAIRDRDIGLQRKGFFRAKDALTSDGGDLASAKNESATGANLQSESGRAGSQIFANGHKFSTGQSAIREQEAMNFATDQSYLDNPSPV